MLRGEVLPRLDPTARALLRQVDGGFRAAVEAADLPRAGASEVPGVGSYRSLFRLFQPCTDSL